MTTRNHLALPTQIEIVPAEQVGELIRATDRDFAVLERRAAEATAAAAAAEAQARDVGVDPKAATWTLVRLQRFLTSLREEAERDAAATVEVACHRARLRYDSAVAPMPVAEDHSRTAPRPSEPARQAGPRAASAFAPTPESSRPSANGNGNGNGKVAQAVAPAVVAHVVTAPVPAPVEPTPVAWAPAPVAPVPENVVPVVAAPDTQAVAMPAPAPQAAVAQASGPPAAEPRARRRRRIPVSAILEVLAVLLILVFILLRLS